MVRLVRGRPVDLIDSIEYVTVRASNGRGDIVVAEAS